MSEENICNFLCQYQEMTVIVISMSGTICYGKNVNTLKSLNPLQGVAISYNLSVGFECFLLDSAVFIILFTAPAPLF